jgi:hypothetical protein
VTGLPKRALLWFAVTVVGLALFSLGSFALVARGVAVREAGEGTALRVAGLDFTVDDASTADVLELPGERREAAGAYGVVRLAAANGGDRPVRVPFYAFRLVDQHGRLYAPANVSARASGEQGDSFAVQTGQSRDVTLVFNVAADSTPAWLEIVDPAAGSRALYGPAFAVAARWRLR